MANDGQSGENNTGLAFDAVTVFGMAVGAHADFSEFVREVWTGLKSGAEDKSDKSTAEVKPSPVVLSSLPEQRQMELVNTAQLHDYIDCLAVPMLRDDPRSKTLLSRFEQEKGKRSNDDTTIAFERLPEFGPATKELFSQLITHLSDESIPKCLASLRDLQLAPPVGLEIRIKNSPENLPISFEALLQGLEHHNGELPINPGSLNDVGKIGKVIDWLAAANSLRYEAVVDRSELALAETVEAGIKQGRYPVGWRRDEKMDKEAWSSAVIQAIDYYNRFTSVCESIDHLNHANAGFHSDALDRLPEGMSVEVDPETGRLTNLKFGELLVDDLKLSSDANQKKFQQLDAWLSSYESLAQKAIRAMAGDPLHMAGFAEVPAPFGWVNPGTGEYTSNEHSPNDGWQKFNLIKMDTDVESKYDSNGQLKSIIVTPNIRFVDVPPVGYLDLIYSEVFKPQQKSTTYKPDDAMVVQSGPSPADRELIKAKDLPGWLAFQKGKKLASDAVALAMDLGMIAEGGLGLVAGRSLSKIGVQEAIGAALKREIPGEISATMTSQILRRQTNSSLFKLGIGATALLQGNGENKTLDTITDLRHKYFLAMGVMPLLNNPVVRAGQDLAKLTLPEVSLGAGRLAERVMGSSELAEYTRLAQTGGLIKAIRAGATLEKSVHKGLSVAELAFLGDAAIESPGLLQRTQFRPEELQAAGLSAERASVLDHSVVQKLIAFGSRHDGVLKTHLNDYRKSLGPLSNTSADQIDRIIERASELAQPERTKTERQEFVRQLMSNFRYSGEQTKELLERRNGEISEAELQSLAIVDTKSFDPVVQRVAALAALALSKEDDGTWPDVIASRQLDVPAYSVLLMSGETSVLVSRPPSRVEQSISSAELMNLLRSDLHRTSDQMTKEKKSAALYDLGLVSGEQYGSLLLQGLNSSTERSKEDTSRCVIELGRVISRVSAEERVRREVLSAEQQHVARGLTAGLTSSDLRRQLKEVAGMLTDSDLRATTNFVSRFLDKQHIDQEDLDRFSKVLMNPAAHLTAVSENESLLEDLSQQPKSEAEWERKTQAIEYLARAAVSNNDETLKSEIVAAYKSCLNGPYPSLAVKGLDNFAKVAVQSTDAHAVDGAPALRRALVNASLKALNNQLADDQKSSLSARRSNAVERVGLINALTALPEAQTMPAFKASLLAVLDRSGQPDPFREVRAAALKGLAVVGSPAEVPLIKSAAASDAETSSVVRLQAIDTLERLNLPDSELRRLMGELATSEKDLAVSLRLSKYFDATGNVTDSGSQRSRQVLADTIKEQNRQTSTFSEVEAVIDTRLKKNNSIFDYLDAEQEAIRTMSGNYQLLALWNQNRESLDARSFWGGEEFRRNLAREALVSLEAMGQERAFLAYGRQVDAVAQEAVTGSLSSKTLVGGQSVDSRELAVLTLGNLVRGGSRMGEPFFRHRSNYEPSAANPGYQNFSAEQKKLRAQMNETLCRSSNLVPALGWNGKPLDVRMFGSDPWPEMEAKIAKALVSVSAKSTTHLPTIMEQFVKGLGKESNATDETRTILVSGLESMVARPDIDAESRRQVLREVTTLVGKDGLSAQNRSKSLVAMLDLIDRFAPRVFDRYSEDFANARIAVDSRRSNLSYNTPAEVRTRAHQVYNRLWDGVLDQLDRTVPSLGTESQKAELLPTNKEALLAARANVTASTVIDDAVQRIFLATKNEKITAGDPRIDSLRTMASEKFHERVRLAAAIALLKTGADQKYGASQLLDIALNTDKVAYRDDALASLKCNPSAVTIPDEALSGVRANLVQAAVAYAQTSEGLEKPSNLNLIARVNQILRSTPDGPLRNKERCDLQRALTKFGAALLTVGTLQSKNVEISPKYGWINLRDGLEAFGLSDELARKTMQRQDLARDIMRRESVGGNLPHVIQSLAAYGELMSAHIQHSTDAAKARTRSLSILALASALTTEYLPAGAVLRRDCLLQINRAHISISSAAIGQR